jgi:hypothetical protein
MILTDLELDVGEANFTRLKGADYNLYLFAD